MSIYNGVYGKSLAYKHLGHDPKLTSRLEHSIAVGIFAGKVAKRISERNPELGLDAELCEFLGYCHDIGYSIAAEKHELHTAAILLQEGFPPDVATKAMHGQLIEQYGEKEGNIAYYTPKGIEGIILTYCDMSVRAGEPVTMKERAAEILERIKTIPSITEERRRDIEEGMRKSLPRFERYERIVLALAGVASAKEF